MLVDLLIFLVLVFVLVTNIELKNDIMSKLIIVIIIISITIYNSILGLIAAIIYIIKMYVPKEGFVNKKIYVKKDNLNIEESMRPKDSNSLFFYSTNKKDNPEINYDTIDNNIKPAKF